MSRIKSWVALTTAVSAALLLAGCAPGQPVTPDPAPSSHTEIDPASFAGKSMTYLYFSDGAADEAGTRALVAGFEKATGAKVELQIIPFANLEQSLQARLSGSKPPEVARVPSLLVPSISDSLINLTDYFGKDFAKQFVPGTAQTVMNANGDMLGVPSDLTMNGPLINVTQFKKAGVPIPTADNPWTWDEMITIAEKVQNANNTDFAFVLDKSGHRVSTVLNEYGTMLIAPDGTNGLDKAKAVKAVSMLANLMKEDKISKDFWLTGGTKYAGGNEMFLAGQVPIYLSGNWQVSQFAKDVSFEWAAVPNPCAERCGGFPGVKDHVAFKASPNPEMGAYFLKWMSEKPQQEALDKAANWMPTRADLTKTGIDYPVRADDMNVFLAEVGQTDADTYPGTWNPAFNGAAVALVGAIANVVGGQMTAEAAVDDLSNQIDALIKQTSGK